MAEKIESTMSWPDLAIGLYDRLTGRGAEISYVFDNFDVSVPSHASSDASYANWKINGTLKITTRDTKV